MNFNEYQQMVLRTDKSSTESKITKTVAALGLVIEAGEAAKSVRNHTCNDRPLDQDKLCEALGYVLWHVSALAWKYGLPLEGIAQTNVMKLRELYPEAFPEEIATVKKP